MNKQAFDPVVLLRQGSELLKSGQIHEAENICKALQAEYALSPAVQFFTAQIAMHKRLYDVAEKAVVAALEQRPERAHYHVLHANCLIGLGHRDAAKEALEKTLAHTENLPASLLSIAGIYFKLNCYEEAHKLYQKADSLKPNDNFIRYNLATTHRFLGEYDECEALCDQILESNPGDGEVAFLRSDVRKQKADNNHIQALEQSVKAAKDEKNQALIYYALAKELEDVEQWDKSFSALSKASNLRRKHMQYNAERDIQTINDICRCYSKSFIESKQRTVDKDNVQPIFILGMPRTGSTLLERVLSSHSRVVTAGELQEFGALMGGQVQHLNRGPISKEQVVNKSLELDFQQLGETYLSATEYYRGDALHFIDKLPFNSLYCGLIHLALPQAKIIHVTRHPMDTCYSVFKMMFNHAYPFSYDQEELARYYVAYRKLMDHWHSVIPGKILDVAYEDLTEDLEGQARRVLDYCGLEWQDEILEFHKNKEASTTASASQVRQPVYRSSVAKWKRYREQLQPIENILRESGIEIPE